MSQGSPEGKFVLFGQILEVLAYRKSMLCWSSYFVTVCLMFKCLVKMYQHVPSDRSALLPPLLITYCLHEWSDALFPHFHQSDLIMGSLNVQNPQLKFGHFKPWVPFRGLCLLMGVITKGVFKHFINLRNCLPKVKIKLYANFMFHEVSHFTDLQLQKTLNKNTRKCQLHKNATFHYTNFHHNNP
jgi:hypothetical protein